LLERNPAMFWKMIAAVSLGVNLALLIKLLA
jgi:hypothetical protein